MTRRLVATVACLLGLLLTVARLQALSQTTTGPVVAGHVTDARSLPVLDYVVVIFSTDHTKWFANSPFVKLGRAAQDGGFEVVGLPPGEYWVAAVDRIQDNKASGEWEKPEMLRALSARATRVVLAERERSVVMLRLIRP